MKWGFWQQSGWYGKWSKYHLFFEIDKTACGKFPEPQVGHRVIFCEPYNDKKCKTCQKIEIKIIERCKDDNNNNR